MSPCWIATSSEMREIEATAEDKLGLTPESLMERAGTTVFEVVQHLSGHEKRLLAVCGKGNNGGDGFVVARLAHDAGWKVRCVTASSENELGSLCKKKCKEARDAGVLISFNGDFDEARHEGYFGPNTILVDAILGTGLRSAPTGLAAAAIQTIGEHAGPVVSIDVPSGIDADTGHAFEPSVRSTQTVCIGLAKPFVCLEAGPACSGDIMIADIGLTGKTGAFLVSPEASDSPVSINFTPRKFDSNKGDNGHVLIVAGSRQFRGAASLCALGALKSGAGLVTVASIEPVVQAVAAHVPEATFIVLPEDNGAIAADAALTLQSQIRRATCAVFGPGLTQATSVELFLQTLWHDWQFPSVIDADALNLLCKGLKLPPVSTILTPHPGEAARLLLSDTASIQADRFGTARQIASKFGSAVILKGAFSVAAFAEEPLAVNPTGNPGMATGGMGDVLAGVLGTLHRNNFDPFQTCVKAMYLHGLAGDLVAKGHGEIGFSASDLAQFLPRALSILTK